MTLLILGLVIFLGIHLTQALLPQQRLAAIQKLGPNGWKIVYSVISIIGFVLIVLAYPQAKAEGGWIWSPPVGMRHANSLFTLVAFILLVAAYVPRNHFKAKLKHPMTLSVKVWALGHLFAHGSLAGIIVFASFLIWAVIVFKINRQRDRANNVAATTPELSATLITVVVGVLAWAGFAFWGHLALIGVSPFGG